MFSVLLEREKQDLLDELSGLPQNAVIRRINELVKRWVMDSNLQHGRVSLIVMTRISLSLCPLSHSQSPECQGTRISDPLPS